MNLRHLPCPLACCVPLILVGGLLAGCGTPTRPLSMALQTPEVLQLRSFVPQHFRGKFSLGQVTGGQGTSFLWGSKVSSKVLYETLFDSLHSLGLLDVSLGQGRYQIAAELQMLEQPRLALDVTVTATIRYTVLEVETGKVMYQRSVRSSRTSDFWSSLNQFERTRLANEAAVRDSMAEMVRDLVTLPLDMGPR